MKAKKIKNSFLKRKINKTCSICLETVKRPAILQLNCDCKYYSHYKCFREWWEFKNECIICHKKCKKPKNIIPKIQHPLKSERDIKN